MYFNFKKSALLIFTFTFLLSCSSSEIPEETITPDPNPTEKITYNKNVKTIIDNSCATGACHDATSPAAGLMLTNYAQVKNAAQNGNLIARMNNSGNPMPPSGLLSSSTRALIDQWRTDGFLE